MLLRAEPGIVPIGAAAGVAGADGIVDKAASPPDLFEAIRRVARGESALPPVTRAQLDAAAHRVEPDDLALLAMLVDRTSPADVAATLHIDRRRLAKRTERLLGRLRRGGARPRGRPPWPPVRPPLPPRSPGGG